MYGELNDKSAIQKVQNALDNARHEQAEIELCKKNSSFIIHFFFYTFKIKSFFFRNANLAFNEYFAYKE